MTNICLLLLVYFHLSCIGAEMPFLPKLQSKPYGCFTEANLVLLFVCQVAAEQALKGSVFFNFG